MNYHKDNRRGVALITVLGLLSVLTLLSVSFAILMRIERVAARNFANSVRAQEMMQAGLVQAMDKIQHSMVGRCYPCWTNERPAKVRDAMVSGNYPVDASNVVADILSEGGVSNYVPTSFFDDASLAAKSCGWSNVTFGTSSGRIAFVVINCSGLFDANYVGGLDPSNRTSVGEIDISSLPEVKDMGDFATKRTEHITYESIVELKKLQSNIGLKSTKSIASFMPYSYDPGRDEMFTNYAMLGKGNAGLMAKFNVNTFTNYFPTNRSLQADQGEYLAARNNENSDFYKKYYKILADYLSGTGTFGIPTSLQKIGDVIDNLLGYIDNDRVPQTTQPEDPWAASEGVEDIPLVNEICLQRFNPQWPTSCGNTNTLANLSAVYGVPSSVLTNPAAMSNIYEFVVEVWYPFIPNDVADKEFTLQLNVFDRDWSHGAVDAAGNSNGDGDKNYNVSTRRTPSWSTDIPIGPMSFFGTAGPQFRTYKSPPIFLMVTNGIASDGSYTTNLTGLTNFDVRAIPLGYRPYYLTGSNPSPTKVEFSFMPQTFSCTCAGQAGNLEQTYGPGTNKTVSVGVFRAYTLPRILTTVQGKTFICDQGGPYNDENCGTGEEQYSAWGWHPFPLLVASPPYYLANDVFVPYTKEVGDPRSNNRDSYFGFHKDGEAGQGSYTHTHSSGATAPAPNAYGSLGWTNTSTIKTMYGRVGQGVPIFHRNGPLENICEIGNLYQGNLIYWPTIPPEEQFGQSVHILDYDNGGFLLDRLTVHATNEPMHGLISLNTLNTNLLAALFDNIIIGTNSTPPSKGDSETSPGSAKGVKGYARYLTADDPDVMSLIRAITNDAPFWCYQDVFRSNEFVQVTSGTNTYSFPLSVVGSKFRDLARPDTNAGFRAYDYMSENAFSKIVDLLTFRQNIFQIIIAAQVLSDEGVPIAESRALATVYRDAYTGRYFIRSFQWIGD